MVIKIVNPVYCQAERKDVPLLKEVLSCPAKTMKTVFDPKQKRYRKKEITYPKYFIDKDGFFLLGFLDRVKHYFNDITIANQAGKAKDWSLVEPQGITLREDQRRIVEQALELKHGIIKSPTGSGKTILAASLIHSIQTKTVFLCHTLTLANQAHSDFRKVSLIPSLYTGTNRELSRLTISTIQSFSKLNPSELADWDLVIVDESHHCSSLDTMYGKTLRMMPAQYKFGLTATVPSNINAEHYMTMEGLFGQVIGELSLQEGIEKGILAKPKVKILRGPDNKEAKELRKYQDVYQAGIVRSFGRNNLIIKQVKELAEQGKTTLILVNKIEHGQILERIGLRNNLKIQFIQGSDDGVIREDVRSALTKKEIDCVIATTIWKEGVNVPSLNCIMNAGGGKSEIATLQSIGRGLRTTEDKKEVLLIDIFDNCHYYLVNHFGERMLLYIENSWI